MLCEECGERPATVHFTKVVNNNKQELHICAECAKNKEQLDINYQPDFSFHKLLTGILNKDLNLQPTVDATSRRRMHCERCGLDYRQFTEKGFLGCSDCYRHFGEQLEPIFKKIHGHTRHTGKVPERAGGKIWLRQKIKEKKEQLKQAVTHEEYEQAAELRDQIREMEQKLDQ